MKHRRRRVIDHILLVAKGKKKNDTLWAHRNKKKIQKCLLIISLNCVVP